MSFRLVIGIAALICVPILGILGALLSHRDGGSGELAAARRSAVQSDAWHIAFDPLEKVRASKTRVRVLWQCRSTACWSSRPVDRQQRGRTSKGAAAQDRPLSN